MTDYKQDLGLKESIAIIISRIIGSGIFRVPASIMALVGCTSLFGAVWIIGGLITIFGAVIYAELSEDKKTIAFATSKGAVILLSGVFLI